MAVDLKQFHQVFIEESVEGLDAMESALMELDVDAIDDEVINTIFRSAHSIKGGGGTFGFTSLANFTHVLETLLDEVRSGKRSLTPDQVNLLLQSVDCMRDMLDLIRDERNEYTSGAVEIQAALEAVLAGESTAKESATEGSDVAPLVNNKSKSDTPDDTQHSWIIEFQPNKDIIRTGNDPLRLLRELCDLAETSNVEVLGEVPGMHNFSPEDCIFGWKIELHGGSVAEESIREVFEWVEDECELTLSVVATPKERFASIDGNNAWSIHFAPTEAFFQTGNDPLRIINELASVAKIEACELVIKAIPEMSSVDPEKCYLAWDITISNCEDKSQIDSVFEWAVDDSDLAIKSLDIASNNEGPEDEQKESVENPQASSSSTASNPATLQAADQKTKLVAGSAPKNQVAKSAKPKAKSKSASSESSSIRVGIDKIDSLINMVGELVITQSMLGQLGGDFEIENLPKLIEGLGQLEQNTRELQESVMRIRMLPISFAFSRFPRMVRDLGQNLNKKINLVLQGENTELDKTVMEKIGDPLVHLVRNSVDHGIETSEDRIAAGKPEMGTVTLNAYHQGGNVVIEIVDDGKGLDRNQIAAKGIERGLINENDVINQTDEQIFDLIFQPGFSTAAQVSDLSGRGVGMDVVKKNIQALNGVVEIQSKKGSGTKIRISLPLTLAILDGQLVRVGQATYIFPLVSIVESMQYRDDLINHIAGGCSVFKLRDEYVPIVDLAESFGGNQIADYSNALMVVVECDGFKVAMLVDELQAQQQVVIKSLEQNYKRIEGISGATILGDGTVALIIDVPGVVRLAGADQLIEQQSLRKSA